MVNSKEKNGSKIYRFMTLTELPHLLNTGTLKYVRLSTMDDSN